MFESLRDDWSILPYYGEAVILETVLSLDNIVVFHQIFESLRVPNSRRPSILLLAASGSWSACDSTLFLVFAGMLSQFWPAFIVIGLYLAYQGYQTMIEDDDDDDDDDDEQAQGVTTFDDVSYCLGGSREISRKRVVGDWGRRVER